MEEEDNPRKVPRKPKKKVSRKKRVTVPKRRGEYKPKATLTRGEGAVDLAECLFSDEDERAEFLEDMQPFDDPPQEEEDSKLEAESHESELQYATSSTASESRPSSQLSVSSVSSKFSESASELRSESAASTSSAPSFTRDTPTPTEGLPGSSSSLLSPTFAVPRFPTLGDALSPKYVPPTPLIEEGLSKLRNTLKSPWFPIADTSGFHLLLVSPGPTKAIKRQISMSYEGSENIFIHCVPLLFAEDLLTSVFPGKVRFESDFVDVFIERANGIVKALRNYKVCVGANHIESRDTWWSIPNTYVDRNPYQEEEYSETCRSFSCLRLVELSEKLKRCVSCSTTMKTLQKKKEFLLSDTAHPNTPNLYLTPAQAVQKLKLQHSEMKKQRMKIAYLTQKIHAVLNAEGVDIDGDVSSDLSSILSNHDQLTPMQRIFLEEQLSSAGKAGSRSHRWHPCLIRLALYIKMVSSAAYEALRDSGAVKLPSSRTLYDYSHPFDAQEGVSKGLLKMVHEKISNVKHSHQMFVALLCDEMHVSKNLVYKQSDGKLVGYVHLDEVDKEITKFEQFMNNDEPAENVQLATKVLAFMVKGLTSDVKYVIGSYPCNQLTKDLLYVKAWDVISQLERAQIKVLAFVSDGSAVNRSFINMHSPLTKTNSGIVFDTTNICAPDGRPLFFIADVAHLLKTIRNCFYNSGEDSKKPRCLQYNGENILWKVIIRLYLTYKKCNLRKAYKLNAQNVFPNSYSCMKVRFAAEVLSDTVALNIEQQNWPGTTECVRFIRNCNKFFDCLNGAHSSQHIKSRNPNLAPYTSESDTRFAWLQSFLEYLEDWKLQVKALQIPPTEQAKRMLSHQTLEGIEIAIKGFTGATKFMLTEGAQFIMARAFSQDPLEQHFSRQRAGGGGSTNPNVSQFLSRQVSLGIQRDLGVRRRKGNVEDESKEMEISNAPLPKRSRKPSKAVP